MFDRVVNLYRSLGRPAVDGNAFIFKGVLNAAQLAALRDVERIPPHFGYLEFNEVNAGVAEIEFRLPASASGRFHLDLKKYISSTRSLNFGNWLGEFYVVDIDYYSGDIAENKSIENIKKITRFIKALSLLAAEGGSAEAGHDGENRLLFIVAADGKSPPKTLNMPVVLDETMLGAELAHMRFLELIVEESSRSEIHMEERRMIMRLAIAETLSGIEDSSKLFGTLVEQWRAVLTKYRHNFLAFASQYSFEKVRKEIATAQVDHATKLSAVLGDIAGKLLALPVSYAAIVLVRKAADREEFLIGVAGLVTVSIIFFGILLNQWMQVSRIRASFDFIFGQYDQNAFPKKLRAPVESAKRSIQRQYRILAGTFVVFSGLAAIPALAAFYIMKNLPVSLIDACLLLSR